jgi:glycerate 2-kinase
MDYISSLIDLESKIEESSAVFTGEGSFDTQTLQGKVVSKMLNLCLKHKKPLYILCGINKLDSIDMTQLLS